MKWRRYTVECAFVVVAAVVACTHTRRATTGSGTFELTQTRPSCPPTVQCIEPRLIRETLVLLDEPLQDLAYPLASCWKNDGFTYRGCYQAMTLEGPEWRMVGWKRDARGGVNVGLACGPDYRDVLTISFEPEVKAIWRGSACCDVDSVGAWRELSATNEVAIAHVGPGHRDTCLQAR